MQLKISFCQMIYSLRGAYKNYGNEISCDTYITKKGMLAFQSVLCNPTEKNHLCMYYTRKAHSVCQDEGRGASW